ncbi:hypothetical protein HMI54_012181 [Coelomomyces lativittatus]|nr:hypothetical protein HMI56_004030 [Coelomomyces lativittatus]KAJ1515519.1 hypothetical protein HMI54_012181 [Coelomomyces lativittatus]KAJ1518237.1 hypothetical protein HMI55_001113 [Coelomomyces lativittatus]
MRRHSTNAYVFVRSSPKFISPPFSQSFLLHPHPHHPKRSFVNTPPSLPTKNLEKYLPSTSSISSFLPEPKQALINDPSSFSPDASFPPSPPPFFSPTLPQYRSGPFIRLGQQSVCSIVGVASYFFLRCFNKLKVDKHGVDAFKELVFNRPKGIPLITISNHASTIDDPILWGLLPLKAFFSKTHKLRWSLGAQEICYSNKLTSFFSSLGKVLPIVRGKGVYQAGMDSALELLSNGQWIHIFPEGKVHQAGGILRFKWGVGRLIAECSVPPIVVLIHHSGFSKVYPLTPTGMLQQWLPKWYQSIKVKIDDPINMSQLRHQVSQLEDRKQWKIITDFLQAKMQVLAIQNEGHLPPSIT